MKIVLTLCLTMKIVLASDRSFQPASHEDPRNPGVFKKILMEKYDFFDGTPQMINWAKLPAGKSFEPHYHEDMQEVFIIVSGTPLMEVFLRPELSGQSDTKPIRTRLNPGDVLVVDPNEVHVMINSTDDAVEYVVMGIAGNKNGKTVRMVG